MATWQEFSDAAPELAAAVQARFDAHRHKVLATLRKDGSPRVSGIEASFAHGELLLGGMLGSLKFKDLERDPRMALHSGTEDPGEPGPGTEIDAKIAGRAVEVTDADVIARFGEEAPPEPFHLYRVELTEAVLIKIGDPADHLVIDTWHEGVGLRSRERR